VELLAGAGADDVAADLFQERELLRGRVERHEVHLHRALALAEDLARDAFGSRPLVLSPSVTTRRYFRKTPAR